MSCFSFTLSKALCKVFIIHCCTLLTFRHRWLLNAIYIAVVKMDKNVNLAHLRVVSGYVELSNMSHRWEPGYGFTRSHKLSSKSCGSVRKRKTLMPGLDIFHINPRILQCLLMQYSLHL